MSSNEQTPAVKTNNIYTVVLLLAFAAVLVTAGFVAFKCQS